MTINLPENLERSILAEVDSGRFASVDVAIAEAVRLLLGQRDQTELRSEPAGARDTTAAVHKPIWEVFEEITASISEEEWAKLPIDGAEQHDHYIYGTLKRDGKEFLLAEVDDFACEVALVRQNPELMTLLKERSEPGPALTLDQVKDALGLN